MWYKKPYINGLLFLDLLDKKIAVIAEISDTCLQQHLGAPNNELEKHSSTV